MTFAAIGLGASGAGAFDLSGTARLFWTGTDFDASSSETLEQRLTFNLGQQLTPYLRLQLRTSYFDQETTLDVGEPFSRRFRQPSLDLFYSRPKLTARLGYNYRLADGSALTENFEATSLSGNLSWLALPSLTLRLYFRNEVNENDVAALGRDIETQNAGAEVLYRRRHWLTSYTFGTTELERSRDGLRADQNRHELRLEATRSVLNQRLSLGVSARVGRSDISQDIPASADLAEPVPASQGLFAIDVTPGLGELEPAPGLIDGDFVTPVAPPIDIGGANTFRNIGLDLGITLPVSRLEVSVNRPSDPRLIWEVYRSRDNLFWEPVAGVRSEYDPDLLRHIVRFPEIVDRFLKVVNVSTNAEPQVLVTELRALRDLPRVDRSDERRIDTYRVDASAGLVISSRMRGTFAVGSFNDETQVANLITRDRRVSYANAGLDIDLARALRLTLGYRWTDEDDATEPRFDRTTTEGSANLLWDPLPTVGLLFGASSRDELARGELVQRVLTSRFGLGLQLLDDLRLISDLSFSRLEDPFADFDRDAWLWTQRLQARLLRGWRVGGGYSYQLIETPQAEELLRRADLFLDTTWTPAAYLTVTGAWRFSNDAFTSNLRQTYGLFYTPGPKLSLSASWEEFDADTGRLTGNERVGLTYRLYRRVVLSGSLSRSRTVQEEGPRETITSARTGLLIGF